MTICSIIFWSIWRRLYGEGMFRKYLSRAIQTIIAIIILAYQLYMINPFQFIIIVSLISLWIIIEYWSRAVGEIIDAGLNPHQDKKSYNRWFRVICNRIVSILNKILPTKYHIHKYYGIYDWIYSSMRNFVGVLPALFLYPSWQWAILIICQYPIYRFCYWLFNKFPDLWCNQILKKISLNEAKNIAEIIHGATFGLIVS